MAGGNKTGAARSNLAEGNAMRLLSLLLLASLLALAGPVRGDDGFPVPSASPEPGDEGGGLIIPEGYTPPPLDIPIDEPAEEDAGPPDEAPPDPAAEPDGPDPGESIYEPPVLPAEDRPFDVTPEPPAPAGGPETPARPGRIDDEPPGPAPGIAPGEGDGFGIDLGAAPAPGGRIDEPSPVAGATAETRLAAAPAGTTAEDELAAAPSNPGAEKLFEEGTRCFNAKDYAGAAAAFRRAIELDPANDVYKLALEMVESTLAAQAPPAPPAAGGEPEPGTPTDVLKLGDRLPEPPPPPAAPERPKAPAHVRSASGSLMFQKGAPVGDLKFWKGRGASVDGDTALLAAGKAASDFTVGFRIPGKPVKAMAILTHATSAGGKIHHPLRITLNKVELLDGTWQLRNRFADHVFNLTAKAKQGINILRFSQKTEEADYLLRKLTIFVQFEK